LAGRKSKYSSENSNINKAKIWSVAVYIRLSQEDSDNGEEKSESNSITSQKALLNEFIEDIQKSIRELEILKKQMSQFTELEKYIQVIDNDQEKLVQVLQNTQSWDSTYNI